MEQRRITINCGTIKATATLARTKTADLLWAALPFQASASTWGDEIYFRVPVQSEEENAQEVVSMGDVGYWPPGQAFCLFFGPTPASRGDEIRPASPVNLVGRLEGDPTILKQVRAGTPVRVEKA